MGLHERSVQIIHELGPYSGKFGGKVTALFYDKEKYFRDVDDDVVDLSEAATQ
jgi:hypothetical protein